MRYRRVQIWAQLLVESFVENSEYHIRCIKGLPSGTKFCYTYPTDEYNIWMVVTHESFDELKNGDIIPIHPKIEMEKL